MIAPPPDSSAVISSDGRYRYTLSRRIEGPYAGPEALVILLNPSTADATVPDPTVTRLLGFAEREGWGWLHVVNLFALRGKDPRVLDCMHPGPGARHRADSCPECTARNVGPHGDDYLRDSIAAAELIVVGWGAPAVLYPRRVAQVRALLEGRRPVSFGVTKEGHPRHPLYVHRDRPLVAWPPRSSS